MRFANHCILFLFTFYKASQLFWNWACNLPYWCFDGMFIVEVAYVISNCVTNAHLVDTEEKTYGGCEGPDAMYVKLISSDGHEFIVKREHALTSGTIKAMLSGPGEYILYSTYNLNINIVI